MSTTRSRYPRKPGDLYETEPWATEALLRRFPVASKLIWEPAAGNHAIVEVLTRSGAAVIATDVSTYNREQDLIRDFLIDEMDLQGVDGIVTNPPYGPGGRTGTAFVERALELLPTGFIAMLMSAVWDSGKTRMHLTRDCERFVGKIVLVDRVRLIPGSTGSGSTDHAWYIWWLPRPANQPPILYYESK